MAGAKVRGITIELSADASGINDGLKKANSAINSTQKELRDIEKLLKLDPTNVTLLAQKHEALQRQITNTRDKLDLLKKAEEDLTKQMENGGTEEQQKQLAALQREIISTERDLGKYEKQLDDTEQQTKELGQETGKLAKEERNADDATSQLSEGFTVLKGTLANLIAQGIQKAASAVKNFAVDMIDVAAEVKASNSQFEQAFGDLADDASAAIDRVSKTTGILSTRLKGSATQIYAFARASGADTTEAMALMETALMAAADSAAYYDKSLEDSTETLQSFLKGNFANDAALGVSATEYTRNAKAVELFGKKYSELTEIQKQQTLLRMVTDAQKLSGAMGQASREASGWENVQGNLNETLKQFKANVGTPFLEALIPVLQRGTQKMQAWMNSVDWNKFGNKVKGALDKMVNGFEWIIKHGGEIKAILSGIVAAFAVTKVASFATAVHGMISALISATAAQEGLNAAVMANPYVALAAAIAACVTAFVALENESWKNYQSTDANWQKTNELTEAIEEHCDAIDSACAAYQTLEEARQETLNSGMAEMAHVQSLSDELATLADESGNVTDQDRARAAFILGELNNALGTEYTMTGNVIDNYNELTGAIDALIEKKKAELILQAEENAYREAIINRADAERNLEAIENDRIATETQLQDVTRQKNEILAMSSTEVAKHQFELSQLDAQEMKLRKALEQTNGAYENARDMVGRYTHDITQYEDNMTKSLEGDYDKIQHKSWETAKAEQDAAEQASTAMAKATEKGASDMVSAMTNASKNIPAGVASGINQNAWLAANAAATLAQQITAAYNNNMGIHSPSTVMEASTKWWIKGFPVGIKKNKEIAFKSIDQFGADITQRMNRSMNRVKMPAGGYDYSVFAGSKAAEQTAGGYGIEEIAGLLQRYLPDLANMKVVLDGETTVGKLAPGINRALGRIQTAEARGM